MTSPQTDGAHLVKHEDFVDPPVVPEHLVSDADGCLVDGSALLLVALPSLELEVDKHDGGRPHL